MNIQKLEDKIKRLERWNVMLNECQVQYKKLYDEIINEMIASNIQHWSSDKYIANLNKVTTLEFDTEALKQDMPEIYYAFLKKSLYYELNIK